MCILSLYEGTTLIGTIVIGSGGSWFLSVTLSIGTHVLTAKQTDLASGGVSNSSSSVTVTVNPVAPATKRGPQPVSRRQAQIASSSCGAS